MDEATLSLLEVCGIAIFSDSFEGALSAEDAAAIRSFCCAFSGSEEPET
jgi:hypothetical protein